MTFRTKIDIYTFETFGVEVEKVDKVERVEVEGGKVYPSPVIRSSEERDGLRNHVKKIQRT